MSHTYLESYGVLLDVEVQAPELEAAVQKILPPGWRTTDQFPEDGHLTITAGTREGLYDVYVDGGPLVNDVPGDVAVHAFDAQLRAIVALLAKERVFVHAGAVAVDGRAIVIPAASFAGKSSLVAALVRAGAEYYSDEYAVLDDDGRLHPYAKPLSLRIENQRYGDAHPVETLGGRSAEQPAEVALIVATRFEPNAQWSPQEGSAGAAALELLINTVPAQVRRQDSLKATAQAAQHARFIRSVRGDADETAQILLAELQP